MTTQKKYYWLKLKKNFFKRHDIMIIEAMPNGKDYILFYLKLLVESVDHEGELRFNDAIPYSEQMLATITNTNIDIVRSAMKVFTELKMIEVLDDSTIFMSEVQKMLGSESYWAEQKRKQRQKRIEENKGLPIGQCPKEVQCESNMSNQEIEIDIELDKEKEIEIDKNKKSNKSTKGDFVKPTVNEIEEYCKERNNSVSADTFYDFYESKGWMVGKNKMKNWKAAVRTWERNRDGGKNESKHVGATKASKPTGKYGTYI